MEQSLTLLTMLSKSVESNFFVNNVKKAKKLLLFVNIVKAIVGFEKQVCMNLQRQN